MMADHENDKIKIVADFDSPWKEVIEQFFENFMALFFPEAHAAIAWDRGFEFLDKELQKVVRDANLGRRLADKLVKVWRHDGIEEWVLTHIEAQGEKEENFPKRMFVYHYRIFDRYDRKVVSLAILTDDHAAWRPSEYGYSLWGCSVDLKFPIVKLLDYEKNWELLEASDNPFAIVVAAHLKAKATRHDPEARYQWKWQLTRRLYERGFSRQDILNLFRFIDWVMELPTALAQRFDEQLEQFEEEKKMRYVTQTERIRAERYKQEYKQEGKQEGKQEYKQEGGAEMLLKLICRKFGQVPDEITSKVKSAKLELIETWCENILFANSLDDVFVS